MKRVNTLINYLSLLFIVGVLILSIIIFKRLDSNQIRMENKINCVASYFTMPHRTGDTTLNCK